MARKLEAFKVLERGLAVALVAGGVVAVLGVCGVALRAGGLADERCASERYRARYVQGSDRWPSLKPNSCGCLSNYGTPATSR
jgi:hypothetical protein